MLDTHTMIAVLTKACVCWSSDCSDPVDAEFSTWVKAKAYCSKGTGSPCCMREVKVMLAAR